MADGDTGTGTAKLLYADAPKGKGPWRYKTDCAGGVPEQLKSWDALPVHPGTIVTFGWREQSRPRDDGGTWDDFFVTSAVAQNGQELPIDGGKTPTTAYEQPQHELEKRHSIDYWAALSRANEQIGPGATLEEYETRTGALIAGKDKYVKQQTADIPF